MKPQLPSTPTTDVNVLSVSWVRKLLACVKYGMDTPRGDERTIFRSGGVISAKRSSGSGGSSASEDSNYLFEVKNKTDMSDPENPVLQVNRKGGSVRIGNSTQNIDENLILQPIADTPMYWHLKWTYNVLSSSIATFELPEDVIDTNTVHSEQLPTTSNPIGIIWITIAKIETVDNAFKITNYIISQPNILVYNSCPDGVATEVT